MNRPPFRPPDFWKSALMTLPDNSFFELLRSVFGNIKTPFNKQRLLADLTALLSREEIQKTIFSYIDEDDSRIIAAVALLGEPAPGELESFFTGELSYAALHDILLNLEERLILYRFREEGLSRLALNPVLEPVLSPFILDRSRLLSSVPAASPAAPPPAAPDDRILGGVLSFVAEESLFFKNEGGIRKKVLDAGALIFPGLDLELIAGGLQILGLFRVEEEGLVPDDSRLAAFAELSPRERMEYCAAGACCFQNETGTFEPAAAHLFRGRVRFLALLIHRFMDLVEPERWYPLGTLKKYGNILEREEGLNSRKEGAREEVRFETLLGIMEQFGLIFSPAPGYWSAGSLVCRAGAEAVTETAPGAVTAAEAGADTGAAEELPPVLAMDTPFSCIVYPGISFTDMAALSSFLTVREAGAVVRFELTRESAIRGFDRGLDAETMTGLLKSLSRNRIDEALIWSVKDWEKRYGEVNLRRGIVMILSEDRRYLAEAGPVAELVRETLAPGVYLLSGTETREAAEALRKAGVDIVSRRSPSARARPGLGGKGYDPPGLSLIGGLYPGRDGALRRIFPPLKSPAPFPGERQEGGGSLSGQDTLKTPRQFSPASPGADPEGQDLREELRTALEKMSLSREERDELSARINRRLILSKSHLAGASVRYEKLEARLLDYVGKAAIAKQAISSKSPVEVIWPHPQKGACQVIGIPSALEKNGGESILILNPLSPLNPGEPMQIPGDSIRIPGDSIRIPLGKISLLRRIKKSIFGE